MAENAVIYIRVSTPEQARDPLNMQHQEERCRAECRQRHLNVVQMFTDRGESARTSDRPEFQRMLAYCKDPKNEVRYVVIQDLSRFARNSRDQAEAIYTLGLNGVRLRSTYESNIDETAAGKLIANIFGAFNQFWSDAHSEKQRDRKRAAINAGRVPWRASLGYINVQSKGGPNITPDPERAPLILEGFQLVGLQGLSKTAALKIITEKGLTTRDGKSVSAQAFDDIIENPIYAGWVTLPSDPEFKPVMGLHEPIVPQALFDRVQALLAGKRPKHTQPKTFNPAFPLRHQTHCGHCKFPLTAAFCKSTYPRYWCRNSHCTCRISRSKAAFELDFVTFLERLRPSEELLSDFATVAENVWATKQGDFRRELKRLSKILAEKKQEMLELVLMRSRREVSLDEFEAAKAVSSRDVDKIEKQILRFKQSKATSDAFVQFAQLQVTDLANLWKIASSDQKWRLQQLLFDHGLEYYNDSGFVGDPNPLLFVATSATSQKDGLLPLPLVA